MAVKRLDIEAPRPEGRVDLNVAGSGQQVPAL
jgi:hypothetical protein